MNAFGRWLKENRYTDQAFADALMEADPELKCSASTVKNWRTCISAPRARPFLAIGVVCKGEITLESFTRDQDAA